MSAIPTLLRDAAAALDKAMRKTSALATGIVVGAVGAMVPPVVADITARLLFNHSLGFVMETEELLLVCIVFVSMFLVQRDSGQMRIDFVVSMLGAGAQKALALFAAILAPAMTGVFAWQAFQAGLLKMRGGDVTFYYEIKIWILLFAAAFCFALLLIMMLRESLLVIADSWEDAAGRLPRLLVAPLLAAAVLTVPVWVGWTPLAHSHAALGGAGMGFLFLLLFMGVPLGIGMGIVGFFGLLIIYPMPGPALSLVGSMPLNVAYSYILTVLPMFMLMGEIITVSGISRDLFQMAGTWLGRLPGGLAVATVAGCAGFAAVCGESLPTAVAMSSVALPEMRRHNYHPGLACATVAAGGTLGILIPPSIGFIFYAILTEASVGKLFLAGVLPGLLLVFVFSGLLILLALARPEWAPRGTRTTMREKLRSVKKIGAMLILIVLVMGGIVGGFFTPTEGGAVGSFGAFLIALQKRSITWQNLYHALLTTARITSKLMFILFGVHILSSFMSATSLPENLAGLITSLDTSRYVILAFVILFYVLLGCVMNVVPMLLLTMHTIFPSVVALGFDPVWFGVVIVLVMEIGLITPPIGMNVYVISSIAADVPMLSIFKFTLPAVIAMLICILLIIVFPGIALWLPGLF